jgi:NADH-quinone oxidoreductase subunit E
MAQIGKDYYEDLTADTLRDLIGRLARGEVPVPGPQNGRYAAEPLTGLTSLKDFESGRRQYNASVQAAVDLKDTVRRIDGSEVALTTPWLGVAAPPPPLTPSAMVAAMTAEETAWLDKKIGDMVDAGASRQGAADRPAGLAAPHGGKADDLKLIKGIGPKLEALCHSLGYYHFDQIAAWTPAEVAWVDDNLEGFKGRVTRDEWVRQARELAKA